jgi:hypothetical protein
MSSQIDPLNMAICGACDLRKTCEETIRICERTPANWGFSFCPLISTLEVEKNEESLYELEEELDAEFPVEDILEEDQEEFDRKTVLMDDYYARKEELDRNINELLDSIGD